MDKTITRLTALGASVATFTVSLLSLEMATQFWMGAEALDANLALNATRFAVSSVLALGAAGSVLYTGARRSRSRLIDRGR